MMIGIDLGTTHSLVAVWRDGVATLIPNALGETLTPSCVSVDANDEILVGQAAKERLQTHPDRTAANFKCRMGSQQSLSLAGKPYRPEELSALVLKSLKADAEAFLGEPVTEAVITVPAYFNDTQRKATRTAGELAGLKVARLLNEPTAAALAYGLHHAAAESQFLVFDLGGGTFDVSILERFDGVMEVRATAGDNHLGGEDFTQVLVDGFVAQHSEIIKPLIEAGNLAVVARLWAEAERAKRQLSQQPDAEMKLVIDGESLTWTLTSAQYEQRCQALVERLRAPVERAVRDARLKAQALSDVVLVGGATRMPMVSRLVTRLFGRFPRHDLHPDEAIALGAAIQSGLYAQDAALDDVVLTDVCPYTLGVEMSEEYVAGRYRHGLYLPVLERNTVIPASRSRSMSPLYDKQEELSIRVYQGESREVRGNVYLGTLDVPLSMDLTKDRSVDIRFTYDSSGLLEVQVKVMATGAVHRLVITQNPTAMTPQEIEAALARLAGIKLHPRETAANRALLARLERLHEERLGDERRWLQHQALQFERVLEAQDPRSAERARAELSKVLDDFERDAPL